MASTKRTQLAVLAVLVALLLVTALAVTLVKRADRAKVSSSEALTTWWFADHETSAEGPVSQDNVRRSASYDVRVATVADPEALHDSFVHLSIPRNGRDKQGYTEEDGAEFASEARLSMSWSSFLHTTDVWVEVSLRSGATITSADQVTIRPTALDLRTELVDQDTVRVMVPHREQGTRFSVEFDPELFTSYVSLAGDTGMLTTQADGNRAIHTEPRNALVIFAEPRPTGDSAAALIPPEGEQVLEPEPGALPDLSATTAEAIRFRPGVYWMGPAHHARLPKSVRWIHLDPGAYVKGAFQFIDDSQPEYKVTGYGVLSGEDYVYEADTNSDYRHLESADNCHESCVKMLQFASSGAGQKLLLHGVTIANPPYHSFVVYGQEQAFSMTVEAYKQVGAWYWQTDGIELYDNSTMRNTFFHANDDVLKLYHSRVSVQNTVIWKNENGPVIQWGWTARNMEDVVVKDTHVIHNRMAWADVKFNTCILNSSSHWEDMSATTTADPAQTVKNLRFENITVEGATNCAIRIYAQSNTEDIEISNLAIEKWNDLDPESQVSTLQAFTNPDGQRVRISGLALDRYTVGGEVISKAAGNTGADELGRLGFDPALAGAWTTSP